MTKLLFAPDALSFQEGESRRANEYWMCGGDGEGLA
jgi:hypothetical protein